MSKKVAINGFGRIGRLTFRILEKMANVEVVAINDLTDNETLAHLLKYDSAQGIFDATVSSTEDSIIVDGRKIHAYAEKDPKALPWKDLGVDVVLDCTGVFRNAEKLGWHIEAGAKKVVLSAPGEGDGIKTIVIGVNDHEISEDLNIYSNASCTTNCLSPAMKLVIENFGYVTGSMVTIHAYTQDQSLQDAPHKDLRRARAAAVNIIPTTTGAAKAAALVLPQLKGKMTAMSYRVPVITGSLVEINCLVEKSTTTEEIRSVFKAASEGSMKGILEYSDLPLVSSDIIGNPHSCIFDADSALANDKYIKVVCWYDNEAGYSNRLAELTSRI
jgi:glyceraldehyde 3-phosphate dehydrogenase